MDSAFGLLGSRFGVCSTHWSLSRFSSDVRAHSRLCHGPIYFGALSVPARSNPILRVRLKDLQVPTRVKILTQFFSPLLGC